MKVRRTIHVLPDGSGFFKATIPTHRKPHTMNPIEKLLRAIALGLIEISYEQKNSRLTIKGKKVVWTADAIRAEIDLSKLTPEL